MAYITIGWNDENVAYSCMSNCFSFVLWARLAERSVQSYEKWSFFSVFSYLATFLQVFGHVKGWLMIQLHKIIRASHAVGCPIVFLLFYEWGWQGGVFIIMKNDHFLEFLAVWVLFPKFLGRWEVSYIRIVWNDKVVALPMDFNLVCDLGQPLGVLKMLLF